LRLRRKCRVSAGAETSRLKSGLRALTFCGFAASRKTTLQGWGQRDEVLFELAANLKQHVFASVRADQLHADGQAR